MTGVRAGVLSQGDGRASGLDCGGVYLGGV